MENSVLPSIHVSCAIIEHNGCVLAAQRGPKMKMPLKWELPGGKIEPGESPEQCLQRELFEELGIQVAILRPLPPFAHAYATAEVILHPFVCSIADGVIELMEHAAIQWLPPGKLKTLDWTGADLPVIEAYCRSIKNGKHAWN